MHRSGDQSGRARPARCSRARLRVAGALLAGALAPAAGAMPLPEYVAASVDAAPEVREQVHVYRQVVQDHEIARSGWRPSVDVALTGAGASREAPNTGQRRRDYDSAQADLTVTQNLFDGFDTTNQLEQTKSRISSAAYQLVDVADNVALDAIRAYLDVLRQRRLVELAERNVEAHERILAQIRERQRSGVGYASDIEQTEGRLAQAKAGHIAQQNNLEDAVSELHRQLGRYLPSEALVEPEPPPRPTRGFEGLVDAALAAHPAIRSANDNVAAARFDFERSKSSNYPSLDLRLQQSVGEDVDGIEGRTDESSVMLSLSYNLYRGGADRAEQRKRASALHENEAFRARVRRQVLDALRLAWTADVALEEQRPWLERHAAKALETLELYREEFLLNQRDLLDVLDAESEWNRALISFTENRFAALEARYRVYEALGELFPAVGLAADVTEHDIHLAGLRGRVLDEPVLDPDRDVDGRPDALDHCDNTRRGNGVDASGCRTQPELRLGYTGARDTLPAADDALATEPGTALPIPPETLFANDAPGRALHLQGFSQPENGSIFRDQGGGIVYVPNPGFEGEDRFEYVAVDSLGGRASAWVVVTVAEPPSPFPDVERLRFGYKQLTLEPASEARLDAIAEQLVAHPDVEVEVYAYTDSVGSAAYNERLSRFRAEAIEQMLIKRGIAAERVHTFAMGERDPIADNSTDEGRARNRRGELRFRVP